MYEARKNEVSELTVRVKKLKPEFIEMRIDEDKCKESRSVFDKLTKCNISNLIRLQGNEINTNFSDLFPEELPFTGINSSKKQRPKNVWKNSTEFDLDAKQKAPKGSKRKSDDIGNIYDVDDQHVELNATSKRVHISSHDSAANKQSIFGPSKNSLEYSDPNPTPVVKRPARSSSTTLTDSKKSFKNTFQIEEPKTDQDFNKNENHMKSFTLVSPKSSQPLKKLPKLSINESKKRSIKSTRKLSSSSDDECHSATLKTALTSDFTGALVNQTSKTNKKSKVPKVATSRQKPADSKVYKIPRLAELPKVN